MECGDSRSASDCSADSVGQSPASGPLRAEIRAGKRPGAFHASGARRAEADRRADRLARSLAPQPSAVKPVTTSASSRASKITADGRSSNRAAEGGRANTGEPLAALVALLRERPEVREWMRGAEEGGTITALAGKSWADPVARRLAERLREALRWGNTVGGRVPRGWFPVGAARTAGQ